MIGLIIPLYSGPNSAPVDWKDIMAADQKVPMAVIINPNNGPGRHLYRDYLNPVKTLNSAGDITLGYIPTRNGRMPFGRVRHDLKVYLHRYHVNGIFLDEMPDAIGMNKHHLYRVLHYYTRIAKTAWRIDPGVHIFGNPGTAFNKALLRTGIQNFVEEEDTGKAVLQTLPAAWTQKLPAQTFSEIAYATPQSSSVALLSSLSQRNLSWVYVTNGKGGNPYAHLPAYWQAEVTWIQNANHPTAAPAHHPVWHPTQAPHD